jgi:hypothetical protein
MDPQQLINDTLLMHGLIKPEIKSDEEEQKKRKKSMREIFHVKNKKTTNKK